ncbi:MAG: helix-hairpin-helix domain-containing protein [Thaumarchaeota archaeon]|nr:helix-hairpin-helix domain-containing protein [Nitrososphaerota archaeon]
MERDELLTVFYTSNEIRSGIPELLGEGGVPSERRELKVGDYFCGEISADGAYVGVPVERKEIGDYIRSMNDGRREEQLYAMSHGFPLSYVVTIGSPSRALRGSRVTVNAYVSSLVGCSLKRAPDGKNGQVVTVNLESEGEFVLFLKYLDEKVKEGSFERVPVMQKRSWKPEELLVYVVSSLPGIGLKTAGNLLSHFGSVRGVMNASMEQLMEVDGVGRKRAEEIHGVLTAVYAVRELVA